ncbi:MAG: hypothetical protein NTW32_16955 [Chloroflexi bacterium]|nr:hypothetical protein [Chloroflexota bacterium]
MKRSKDINIVIGIGIFTILAMSAYWYAWYFAPEVVQARTPLDPDYAVYIGYEQAFPLPDLFVTLACAVGVVGLWKMRDWGFLAMLLTAGGAIFLGFEDLLYDLQHNMFVPFNGAAGIELAIVLVIMALGPAMTILLWKNRRDFIR